MTYIVYSLGRILSLAIYRICWKSPNLHHFDIKQSKNKISTLNLHFHFLSDFSDSNLHNKPNHQSARHHTTTMTSNYRNIQKVLIAN